MGKEECKNCGQWFDEDDMVDDLCEVCYEDAVDYEADDDEIVDDDD